MNAPFGLIETISARLRGYGDIHPHSEGRVIQLEPPYNLPDGMDLRGIAGVSLKRQQDPKVISFLESLDGNDLEYLLSQSGRYKDGRLLQRHPMGPIAPPKFELPTEIRDEVIELSQTFQNLTGANELSIWFPNSPAPQFHIDGAHMFRPAWRLTYAFKGPQTEWHRYQRNADTPVRVQGMVGFPEIPQEHIGEKDKDYFESDGPLLFLTHSANGLFHRTPPSAETSRFMVTIDAHVGPRENCMQNCPFPCRKPL